MIFKNKKALTMEFIIKWLLAITLTASFIIIIGRILNVVRPK